MSAPTSAKPELTPVTERRRPPWEDSDLHPSRGTHDIVQAVGWVDHELSNRLAAIIRKLDQLSSQVSGYHTSVSKLRTLPTASPEELLQPVDDFCDHPFVRVPEAWSGSSSSKMANVSEVPQDQVNVVHDLFGEKDERQDMQRQVSPLKEKQVAPLRRVTCVKDRLQPAWALPYRLEHEAIQVRLLMEDPEHSRLGWWYCKMMPVFVILSIFPSLIQSANHPPLSSLQHAGVEIFIEVVFFVDFMSRFIVCPNPRKHFKNFHNVVDLLITLPMLLRAAHGFVPSYSDLNRMPGSMLLYVVPLLRLLKALRGFKKFSLVLSVALKVYLETLPAILMLVYLVLIFATLFYYIEPRDNLENYAKSVWFVCVTMTTVGYGDYTPVTTPGYCLAALLVCSSVFFMAMPLGIIGTAVSEVWKDRDTIILRQWAKQRLDEWGYKAADIPEFFAAFDTDCSGELDFDEFCDMLAEMKVDIKRERMRMLFNSFDDDESGLVDAKEFVRRLYPEQYEEVFNQEPKTKESVKLSRIPSKQACEEMEQMSLRQAAEEQEETAASTPQRQTS